MFLRLVLLFTVVPLVELFILLWLAQHITLGYTILLVIATGVLGAALAKWQGLRALYRIRSELLAGRMPADSLLDGLMILIAGAVLITPGLLTDVLGFALLLPSVRAWVRRRATARIQAKIQTYRFRQGGGPQRPSGDRIIDVRLVDPEEQDERDRQP